MLENILEILDAYEYVLFHIQDPYLLQFLSLMEYINGESFEKKYRLQNGKMSS